MALLKWRTVGLVALGLLAWITVASARYTCPAQRLVLLSRLYSRPPCCHSCALRYARVTNVPAMQVNRHMLFLGKFAFAAGSRDGTDRGSCAAAE